MKTSLLKTSILSICLLLCAFHAQATHLRFGHITWQPQPSISPNTAEFTLTVGFRESFFGSGFSVGSTVSPGILYFGDGSLSMNPFVIVSIDPVNDWFLCKLVVSHTYSAPTNAGTPWLASFSVCCRNSQEVNNHDKNFAISTLVELSSGNRSPISSLPPIVSLSQSTNATFALQAADADPNTELTYRLATASEAGGTFVQPSEGGFPLSVNATTGVVSWNTSATALGSLYSCQIIIEDRDATTHALRTQVPIDFLIQIVTCPSTNVVPNFIAPSPACGSTLSGIVGSPILFTVAASDADANDVVTLNSGGLPTGATMSPGLPTTSNPVSGVFSWTPTPADVGSHVVSFAVSDNCGAQSLCAYTINVTACPTITASLGTNQTIYIGSCVTLSPTISGGVGPYSYLWSNGATTSSITVCPTTATNYSVVVTDANQCTGSSAAITVNAVCAPISANLGSNQTVYIGYAPSACATLSPTIVDGTAPYSYLWSNGATTSSITVCPTTATNYSVVVTDANQCTANATVSVGVVDVRCGNRLDKVLICHVPAGNPTNTQLNCVAVAAVADHLAHGDYLGACPPIAPHAAPLKGLETAEIRFIIAPNPAMSQSTIQFSIPTTEYLVVSLYDLRGVAVATLYAGPAEADKMQTISFDANAFASGMYIAKLQSENYNESFKLNIVR